MSRCFERSFKDAQAFNECANDSNKQALLPPSMLELPDGEGGVEQCVCDCKYVEKSSLNDTGLSDIGNIA